MKITGSRADGFVRSPPEGVVGVLLHGPDRGLVHERADALAAKFVADPDDAFAVTRLTTDDLSEDPARLPDAMSALSLLGDASLVTLRLDHERQGRSLADTIRRFDAEPELAASRLIVLGGEMKTSSALRKAVEAARHFAAIGCYPDGARDLAVLIRAGLEEAGLHIRPDALGAWMERLDGDRALIRAEIEKMILYMGPGTGKTVTVADVDANTAGAQTATLDEIVMSALGGEPARADAAIRRAVAGKTSPVLILIGLQRHLARLVEVAAKTRAGMSQEQALRSLRPPVFPNQFQSYSAQLARWSPGALDNALSQSLEVEARVKTAGAPAEALVARYALALASFATARR